MDKQTYQPKGGMCAICRHVHDKACAELPFKDMRVIERHGKTVIVKCSKFERKQD